MFEGSLSVEQERGHPPTLFLSFRCSACRRRHHHTWGLMPDGSEDWGEHGRQPHCDRAGVHPHGYLVTPARTPANEATYRRYAELLRAHQRRADEL